MISIALIAIVIMGAALGGLLMANVLAIDQHWQYVPLATVTMGGADTFATVQIPDEIIQPDIQLNVKDARKSTVMTWEIQEFLISTDNAIAALDVSDDTDQLVSWEVISDGGREAGVPVALSGLTDEDWVAGEDTTLTMDVVGGSGAATSIHQLALQRYPLPQDWSDGQPWGLMLTQNHYHFQIDSIGTGATMTRNLGMRARRV